MNDFFTDTGYFQKAKHGQNSFGDVIAKKYIKEEDRKIIVLSDGMGSGIKANVLASLTASMALNFTEAKKDIDKASELIMNILPKCSERKISYSTFTILDLKSDGKLSMIVYDAPLPVLIREGSEKEIKWNTIELTSGDHKGKTIYTAVFSPKLNDRLFAFTDGIAQSGLGTGDGEWGREAAAEYLIRSVKEDPGISAADIAEKLVNKAEMNDRYKLKDDASVLSLYFREPRELLICTGAPADPQKDLAFAGKFKKFDGARIIAGGTTSEIIARELGLKFTGMHDLKDALPPISTLETVDLVTEGVMTLSAAERLLRSAVPPATGSDGAAVRLVRHILNSDHITFLVGTAANEYHYGLQYKMRVQLVKDIAETIESSLFKRTAVEFF